MLKWFVLFGHSVRNSYGYFEEKKQAALQCPHSLQTWVYQMSEVSQGRGVDNSAKANTFAPQSPIWFLKSPGVKVEKSGS